MTIILNEKIRSIWLFKENDSRWHFEEKAEITFLFHVYFILFSSPRTSNLFRHKQTNNSVESDIYFLRIRNRNQLLS